MIANILWAVFHVLIFPGFLFAVVIGLLLAGIDRKVVARMQKRVGPPLRQPLFDFLKLCGKETIIPDAANRVAYIAAPIVGFAALIFTALFIPVGGYSAFSTGADLIIILYLLTIPAVCLIVGGAASGSPYAGVGASREMVAMMSYELPFVIVLLAIAKKAGDFFGGSLCFSMQNIASWQAADGCGAFHWSLIPAAIAMLLVIPAEVGTCPFDVAEAETEICEGPLVEYSGAPLGMFKLNTAVKMFIMTSLFTFLFFGGINVGIPVYALNVIVNAVCARLKIEHMFKFYWTIPTALAAISLILVWIGL